jgi:type I restriction enzyme, R subunit
MTVPEQTDKMTLFQGAMAKISENDTVMAQVRNNSNEQIMLGDFPKAMEQAMIDSMGSYQHLSMQYLVAKGFNQLVLGMLLKGLQGTQNQYQG